MVDIYIDADGCPVVNEVIELAMVYELPVCIVCDTSHMFYSDYARVLLADKGRDQSDFLILKHLTRGDIVITQDYGLAALALAKGAHAISQNGLIYHEGNMDELLTSRHTHAIHRKHKQYGHIPKRTKQDDEHFVTNFDTLLREIMGNS